MSEAALHSCGQILIQFRSYKYPAPTALKHRTRSLLIKLAIMYPLILLRGPAILCRA
jgi:hypothetical protein